jgi:hypothetical protein
MSEQSTDFELNHLGQRLADDLVTYHEVDLKSGDIELRDAVIVKMMALAALAYELPFSNEAPFDLEEALAKLRAALIVLEEKKRAACNSPS